MDYFWDTEYSLPAGVGFTLFGWGHLVWLGAASALSVSLALACRTWRERTRRFLQLILAGLLVLDELFKNWVALRAGVWGPSFLPLHLCSINIFLIAADSLHPSPYLRELLYAQCLPGAVLALAFPGWAYLPLWNALCIHSFTAHILLLLYPVSLLAGGFCPQFRRLLKTLPGVLGTVALVYIFNQAFGTNFMFLQQAGKGNPLAWLEGLLGSPGYLLGIPLITAACWGLLYAPGLWRNHSS